MYSSRSKRVARGSFFGSARVDAVDFRRLENRFGIHFDRAQRGGRVGRKVRISGSGGENHDAALFEMADRAAPDVRLGDLVHRDRGLHARGDAHALERVLQRERVDHGREHAHVIGGRAVHAGLFVNLAAPDVSAADDDRDRDARAADLGDLLRHRVASC